MPAKGIPDPQTIRYDEDLQTSVYAREDGLLVLPVMGPPGTPHKVVRVHAPLMLRNVRFAYKKRGAPPVFPMIGADIMARKASPGDPDVRQEQFLGGVVGATAPYVGGNENQLDYVMTGEYRYVSSNVRGSGDNFQTGHHPYQSNLLNAQIFNAAALAVGGAAAVKLFQNAGYPINLVRQLANSWLDPDPRAPGGADAPIDFSNPNYIYYDTEISKQFQSQSLIL